MKVRMSVSAFNQAFFLSFLFSLRFEFGAENQLIQREVDSEQERLSKMDLISEEVCNCLDQKSPDRQVILRTVETLQDR